MNKWMGILLVAATAAFSVSAQTVLEEWTFDTEANGTSFTNLVNTGTEGAAHFGEDHLGTYVTNGALRLTSVSTNDCYRVAEMTTSGLNTGIYELSWDFPHAELSVNNAAFGVFMRSKETYNSITGGKSSTDLFQFRLHVVSGVINVQTRVLQPDGNAGIVNHFAFPVNNLSNVGVRLQLDLQNDVLNGEVVYAGTTNTFSLLMLDLPADYVRFHGTSTKLSGAEYVEFDNIRWTFIEASEPQDIVFTEYLFDTETNGTQIGQCEQTGIDTGAWSASTTANGVTADGAGNLLFTNVTANSFKAFSFSAPISNQVVELEYRLSSWDFNGLSDLEGNSIAFELRDTLITTQSVKVVMDYKDLGATRLNWITTAGDSPRETLGVTNGVDLTVKVQIDLASGTFASFYDLGSGWITKATGQSLGGITQLDDFRLIVDGVAAWGSSAYAAVDYVKVTLTTPKKLIDYRFDDAFNTDLKDLWNNGTITNNWDFSKTGEAFADGTGNLALINLTGWTRRLTFTNAPVSSGVVTMDYRVDAWSLQSLGASQGISISLSDTVSGETVKSKFYTTAAIDDVRVTMSDTTNLGKQKAGFGLTNGVDGLTIRLVNDLDTETYQGFYKMDSESSWTEITTTNTAGLASVDEIIVVGDAWTGTGFVNLDYLSLKHVVDGAIEPTVVPTITVYSVSGSTVYLTWASESGISYNVLSKSALTDGAWSTKLGGIPGAGASISTNVTGSGSAEFYTIEAYAP